MVKTCTKCGKEILQSSKSNQCASCDGKFYTKIKTVLAMLSSLLIPILIRVIRVIIMKR